jgi:hypothetical protein
MEAPQKVKNKDPLPEEKAAYEAMETSRKECGEENQQVHRCPQDWTPGVSQIKTLCLKKKLKLELPYDLTIQ